MRTSALLILAMFAGGMAEAGPVATPPAVANAAPVAATNGTPPPDRIATLVVYGDDPCPRSAGDEIVVCARRPENERYRERK